MFVRNNTEPYIAKGLETPTQQFAFNISPIRGVLQFMGSIAFCRGLHQCASQEIHCEVPYDRHPPKKVGVYTPKKLGCLLAPPFTSLVFYHKPAGSISLTPLAPPPPEGGGNCFSFQGARERPYSKNW